MYPSFVRYAIFYLGNAAGGCTGIAITGVWGQHNRLEMLAFWSTVMLVGVWVTLSHHSSASEGLRTICSQDEGVQRGIVRCCLLGWVVTFGATLSALAAYYFCGWLLAVVMTGSDLAIGAIALTLSCATWISIYYWSVCWTARLLKSRVQRATGCHEDANPES